MKYTVMVINNMFEDDNLLIVKTKGNQSIMRYNKPIEKEDVMEYLSENKINMDDCEMYEVGNDWKGNPKIEKK